MTAAVLLNEAETRGQTGFPRFKNILGISGRDGI